MRETPGALVRVVMTCSALSCAASFAHGAPAPADSSAYHHEDAPRIRAAALTGAVRIDGVLDEAAWSAAEPATAFTQLDPHEGAPASERTEVRVLIGDNALVIGARLFDRDARRIKAQLARRDDATACDAFEVSIDSYHDHLTARRFRVNPSGSIRDAAIGTDGSEDATWDAVWEAAATVDSLGWSCELRIPLSQLRYHSVPDATWGIQFSRVIFRKGETDYFAFTPKKAQGGVNRYGHLTGLGQLAEPRHLELLPFTVLRNERLDFPNGNPFRSRSDYFRNAGVDAKYGVTSDLSLDVTVNPDFGQVEVDPAEVNLTAFETFFPEHRGFFVEGADLFAFGRSRAFNNFSVPTIFNSRRIGRTPQLQLGGPEFGFLDAPSQSTIAGAAKLTGRTRGGWALGMLDAVTTREDAHYVDTLGVRRETPVEPLSQYFAGRVRRDLRGGDTSVGALFTGVNRQLGDPALAGLLRKNAYIGGLDLAQAWAQRSWALDAAVTGSTTEGSASAIAGAQRSSSRYFQRPDHGDYASYDPTRTRLSGYGVDGSISKTSGEHWLGSLAYVSRSPGYEANDLGFQTRADYRAFSSIALYQQNKPGGWFRNYAIFPYENRMWNFGGDVVFDSWALDANGTLANFWSFDARGTLNRSTLDDRLTRGGPQARLPESGSWIGDLTTDSRRPWSVSADYTYSWNEIGGTGHFPSVSASFRPSPTLRIRFEPAYSATHALAQYVSVVTDPLATATYGRRYVFANLEQRTLSLVTRADWTLTPRLSFQLYLQPLVVSGAYTHFKEYREPRTFQFDVYGRQRGTITPNPATGGYTIDPGNGPAFELSNPDFNFRSLLGNAVLRWEYRPGSTLFIVWQQTRTDVEPFGDFDFSRDYRGLVDRAPQNVFAAKVTFWVGL